MTATDRFTVIHEKTVAHEEVIKAALRVLTSERDDPGYAHLDAEQTYAVEQLALAARRLTRATDALPEDEQPPGWDDTCSVCDQLIPDGQMFVTPGGNPMHSWCAADGGES